MSLLPNLKYYLGQHSRDSMFLIDKVIPAAELEFDKKQEELEQQKQQVAEQMRQNTAEITKAREEIANARKELEQQQRELEQRRHDLEDEAEESRAWIESLEAREDRAAQEIKAATTKTKQLHAIIDNMHALTATLNARCVANARQLDLTVKREAEFRIMANEIGKSHFTQIIQFKLFTFLYRKIRSFSRLHKYTATFVKNKKKLRKLFFHKLIKH
jgi:DNA repair exonuclease SbcCD ATPase subunit